MNEKQEPEQTLDPLSAPPLPQRSPPFSMAPLYISPWQPQCVCARSESHAFPATSLRDSRHVQMVLALAVNEIPDHFSFRMAVAHEDKHFRRVPASRSVDSPEDPVLASSLLFVLFVFLDVPVQSSSGGLVLRRLGIRPGVCGNEFMRSPGSEKTSVDAITARFLRFQPSQSLQKPTEFVCQEKKPPAYEFSAQSGSNRWPLQCAG